MTIRDKLLIDIVLTIVGTTIGITIPLFLFFYALHTEKNILTAFLATVMVIPFSGLLIGISWIKGLKIEENK
jgi:hypothetical protein